MTRACAVVHWYAYGLSCAACATPAPAIRQGDGGNAGGDASPLLPVLYAARGEELLEAAARVRCRKRHGTKREIFC